MDSQTEGVMLLCLTCTTPFIIGFFVAWRLRGRVQKYGGLLPALLPHVIREKLKEDDL